MTLAQLMLDRAESGLRVSHADLESIPAAQWEIYWDELRALCPSKLTPSKVRQRNALRIEILPFTEPRCSRLSPDGRGLAWFLSGGDPLAYRQCCAAACPLAREEAA